MNIKINKIIGILFPAIKIEKKTKIKIADKTIIRLFLFLKFIKKGIKKKEKFQIFVNMTLLSAHYQKAQRVYKVFSDSQKYLLQQLIVKLSLNKQK